MFLETFIIERKKRKLNSKSFIHFDAFSENYVQLEYCRQKLNLLIP